MKILVTGGAGFIGSHIVDAYIKLGHEVVVVDNLVTGQRKNLNPQAKFYELDIRSAELQEFVMAEAPDIINHQAAQMNIRHSVIAPCFDAENNILGSINLLEAACAAKVQHFIFASSGGAIYGEQDYIPADEDHPLRPLSPYGIAKLAIEKYLDYYRVVQGLYSISLRYANVYGARQNPKGEAGVVAIFCEKLLRGEVPTINGTGLQTRDYIYIDDVVRANILALNYRSEDVHIFNIGTSLETDLNTIFTHLRDNIDLTLQPIYGAAKPGEQMRNVLAIKRAQEHLNWQPQVSLLDGIKQTIAAYRQELSECPNNSSLAVR